ncbi:MAG: ParB/RepB/Spo0J family partition protein [Candidatus Aminicenantes bacterium]|nr:ParB/RepB/Spo0J family partition protein [Candidatus Aminicenantes bacterium]
MKKALGKGIKAFIPEEYGILKEESYTELEVDELRPSPLQPRMRFDEKGIEELAQSIRKAGVLQPIIVIPEGEQFRILIGERRWRAAQKAGLRKVPVLIRNIPKEQQLEVSLVENLQREELNPIEIARAYERLTEELGYTQEEVGEKVGKDRASVANFLRLLKLPSEIQESIQDGKISMGHAKILLSVEDSKAQLDLVKRIVQKGLSVRATENLVAKFNKQLSPSRKRNPDPNLEAVQEELLRALGTKVAISGNQKKGIINIFYYSLDELNRISEFIKGARS